MDKFNLILSPKAVKDLNASSESFCLKITTAVKILSENPFPRGKLIKKTKGTKSVFYRLRADKYRVFYIIDADKVVILRILNKKDAARFIQTLN
ncbi:MAG: type II toxin-antitoxin system RelE/ParE family toxin [Nitrospirae bacterium]|nr:type II toxin-antitoxin system RelE/ParE family toxin [Nitrospirota bacterium]